MLTDVLNVKDEAEAIRLIEAGVDLTTPLDSDGDSYLYLAFKNDMPNVFEALLANGADVNELLPGYSNTTVLHRMTAWPKMRNQTLKCIELISDLNLRSDIYSTYLTNASACGKADQVSALLKRGADVNAIDNCISLRTPLMKACELKYYSDIAELLLAAQADVNIKDGLNRTALDHAAYNPSYQLIRVLLRYQANPNNISYMKFSPLMTVLMAQSDPFNERLKSVQLLIEHKADVNHVNSHGESVWDMASSYERRECLEYLERFR